MIKIALERKAFASLCVKSVGFLVICVMFTIGDSFTVLSVNILTIVECCIYE